VAVKDAARNLECLGRKGDLSACKRLVDLLREELERCSHDGRKWLEHSDQPANTETAGCD
jgi:hypothetical protein